MILFFCSVSDNNEEKFDRIFKKYYNYAYKIAFNVIKDVQQMEDIMQDIFFGVWSTLDVMTDEQSEKAWIAAIARNTAVNALNKKKTRDKKIMDIDDDILYENIPSFSDDPADIAVDDDSVNFIYSQIKLLDKKYSDVLLLKYKFHCSADKIAVLLGMRVKTVYTRIERGRKILMEKLLSRKEEEVR